MTRIRRADPTARRHGLTIVLAGMLLGALAILAFTHYRAALAGWVASDAGALASRLNLIVAAFATVAIVPSVGFSVYLWSLAVRAIRTREFPPPNVRLTRDTRVVVGRAAVARARALQILAVVMTALPVAMTWLVWRLAAALTSRTGA